MTSFTSRRTFLKLSTAAASMAAMDLASAKTGGEEVALIIDSQSALTDTEPVQWALSKLRAALSAKGNKISENDGPFAIVVASVDSPLTKSFGTIAKIDQPETTALIPGTYRNAPAVLATGVDARGLVYGLLELTDRINSYETTLLSLQLSKPLIERTPNKVRSVARAFVSEIEDKSWFYDRTFWTTYLDMVASARFNRFNFALGFGYDFPRGVTGDYLHFPYPYLVELADYKQVHIDPSLKPGERERNLETLQFIAAETARRGMDFQLGIWTHAYQWTDSPHADHRIVGLTPEIHATYCRDALAALLKACPQIKGLTLRIHGESGIPEGSYPFWATLFQAISGSGRVIEIEMHAKGLNQTMIDLAHQTGMPVKAGAKYWAEHLGLGYQQADIRETEYPRKGVTGTFAVSSGERNFTRYGYGDFYREDANIQVLYRVWPGTQRHLIWGDPALAAGYGRAAHFCGAAGMELCEPLTFKGREGSGHPGGRNSYLDASLASTNPDSSKFAITYLLWGRYLYNPDTDAEVHRRYLRRVYGLSGPALGNALANSSRILPLVTTAWLPSASNHSFWPEIYSPTSMLPVNGATPYSDSPKPHNVSAISPLDPQLFSSIDQHAKDLVNGTRNARYTPVEVIRWIGQMVGESKESLSEARRIAGEHRATSPSFREIEEDIEILIGLGLYFANLFRAALFYSICEQTDDADAAKQATSAYQRARKAWSEMAERAEKVYTADISYGEIAIRRGSWKDRLPEIERDLTALDEYLAGKTLKSGSAGSAIQQVLSPGDRRVLAATHNPPASFRAGTDLILTIEAQEAVVESVLWYRHVNQGERWLSIAMAKTGPGHQAVIPAKYTDSPYPLQYYFELRTEKDAVMHPGLSRNFNNQPYYVVMKS